MAGKLRRVSFLHLVGYEAVKRFAREKGCEIYNATRGGMLEVFPRVDFDEIIVQNQERS